MRKLYYYKEKTKYFHLALLILFLSLMFRDDNADYTMILIYILFILCQLAGCFEGFIILYKKLKCKSKGALYDGKIIEKIGHSTNRQGYFYQLVVRYKGGEVKTPYIQSKYVDKLKSKKCKVYECHNMTYIDGYELCKRNEKPIKIRIKNDLIYRSGY